MLKTPIFSLSAIAVLSLSLGACAAVFTIVAGTYYPQLRYHKPDRIVNVFASFGFSYDNYKTLLEQTAFEDFALWQRGACYVLGSSNEPERLTGNYVTANYLSLFGVPTHLGRTFQPRDDDYNAACTTVLSYSLWTEKFGADANVIGKSIRMNGHACEIIGVMSKELKMRTGAQLWVPMHFQPQPSLSSSVGTFQGLATKRVYAVARLKDGVSAEESIARFTPFVRRLYE